MKIYIAGKITGLPKERVLHHFAEAENYLKQEGYTVLNPTTLPEGLDYEDYMHLCFAMIDVCDEIYLLNNWKESSGAKREAEYAFESRKEFQYEEELMVCEDCKHFLGGGDFGTCCTRKYDLCYSNSKACEEFEREGE